MRIFIEILMLSAFIGLINFCVNPNKPTYIKEISSEQILEKSNWILIDTQSNRKKSEVLFNLNDSNFDSQTPILLDIWTPEKRIGILQNSQDSQLSFKIAKKLKKDFEIDEVYIIEGEIENEEL